MKKLTYLLAGILLAFTSSAQLQNMDFEDWDFPVTDTTHGNRPSNWTWTDGILFNTENYFQYPPSTMAQQNDYALRLSVWYNHTKDAVIQKASISERPGSLSGWYHYRENVIYSQLAGTFQKDTARISVFLTKYNQTTLTTDTIGKGVMDIGDSTQVYTGFLLEINYTSAEMPDSIIVNLDPSLVKRFPGRAYWTGDSGRSSYFTIDNLSLNGGGTAGIVPISKDLKIYPNPVSTTLQFEPISGEGTIFDLTGKKVATYILNTSHSIDIGHLHPGNYLFQIRNHEGTFHCKITKQ
ncbi:hypothetical protein D3C87_84990 [compost metagenome]